MQERATLYVNADIFTMDRDVPRAEALLVRGGRVEALGPRRLVEDQAGTYTRRVDLDGRTMIPGFNDCHCHILSFGLNLEQVDVGADAVRSFDDIKRALARRAEQLAANEWVVGRGYDQNVLREKRHPTRFDLDQAGRGRPVVIWHTSGHALVANSRALQLAGVTGGTETPPGGGIERDEHGEPTGILKEASATDLIARHIPPPSVEEGAEAIIRAMSVMASQGITSASDASTGHGESITPELVMYRKALASGRLSGRITMMPQIRYVAPPDSNDVRDPSAFDVGVEPEWLRIGATKVFADGALTTRTAALRQPYENGEDNVGMLIWSPETLADMVRRAHDVGWQIAIHAIGDRAVEGALDSYEQALSASPREDHRHRIEHCMMLDNALAMRMQRLELVAAIQPGFIGRLGDAYVAALGWERASQLIPMNLFDLFGIRIAFSSDRPVIPGAPIRGIFSAIQRVTPDGVLLGREHTITALQAIRHYTTGSAYATFSDDTTGTLRRRNLADFTVLSRSPVDTPPDDFAKIRVMMTAVGGEEVFSE